MSEHTSIPHTTHTPQQQGPALLDRYTWVRQECPICQGEPRRLGRRGGTAQRSGLGVEAVIWRCTGCGLIFPNPMPRPVGGTEQHYGVAVDAYFKPSLGGQDLFTADMVRHLEQVLGGKGRLLDIGAGRGE